VGGEHEMHPEAGDLRVIIQNDGAVRTCILSTLP
jgi:hypothetical protein